MNRRDFLRLAFRTGVVTAAGLHLPYVPERFYSFAPPKPEAFRVLQLCGPPGGFYVPAELSDLIVADILNAGELGDRRVCITDGGLERATLDPGPREAWRSAFP